MADGRYVTVQYAKDWARDEVTADDDIWGDAIASAEQSVDNATQRRMEVVTAGAPGLSARVFIPPAQVDVLFIDDCTEVTAITDDGTALTVGTDYQLEPLNGRSGSGEVVPYDSVRRLGGRWSRGTDEEATVSITARWGRDAIPAEVKQAVVIMAKDVILARESRFGLAGIAESGGVRAVDNPIWQAAVRHYRGPKSWGIA